MRAASGVEEKSPFFRPRWDGSRWQRATNPWFGWCSAIPNARAAREASGDGVQGQLGRGGHDVRRVEVGLNRSRIAWKPMPVGQADDFADVRVWSERWTPFQRRVLDCCRRIPYGKTQSYAELAIAAGSPAAARAVGRTMATNPIPLVIPCHRVVGSGGDLCGFSAVGGLDAKRRLLALEQGAAVR